MSKLTLQSRVPSNYYAPALSAIFRDIESQVNASSEGRIIGAYNARTAKPTTGTYKAGDFIRNSAPSEAGAGGSKYVILGWICTASGTPGTWLDARVLTGN
jgi:hypothetical protein